MWYMDRQILSDSQWSRIAGLLRGKPTGKGGRAADNPRFVEAVLYKARTGCPWRDLPKELGNWHSVYVRFARWETYGIWHRVAEALQGDAEVVHRRHHRSRPRKYGRRTPQKKGGDQAIGRSRGGLTTKVHACMVGLDNPIRLILTGGQVADITQGAALIEAIPNEAVIADKGYDSDALVEVIEARGAQAIHPAP